ncbi:MAG: zinc ABC transporter substrate-binding protein [Thermoplasmata archaeon]
MSKAPSKVENMKENVDIWAKKNTKKQRFSIYLLGSVIGILILSSAFVVYVKSPIVVRDNDRLEVVASFYPLYFFSKEIAGDKGLVSMLIPDNAEPHAWEPKPSDIMKVDKADVFVYNGAGFEPWLGSLLKSSQNKKLIVVDTSIGMELQLHPKYDDVFSNASNLFSYGPYEEINSSEQIPTLHYSLCENVSLTSGTDGYGASIRVCVDDSHSELEHLVFLSNNVSVKLYHENGTLLVAENDFLNVIGYPAVKRAVEYRLPSGNYTLEIGPTLINKVQIVLLTTENTEEEHEETHEHITDPHFWLDPIRAQLQVENILAGFKKADPKNSEYYESNAFVLKSRLESLHKAYVEGLKGRQKNDIITTHEGFNYLAKRYGFKAHAAVGISADEQPSAKDLARLSELVRNLNLKYIFSEPIYSDAVIETIARETGAQILVLDGIHGRTGVHAKMDYFEIMYANLESLKIGLEVQ